MDLMTFNTKEYTTEQLNALREDLKKLMGKVDVELKERENTRFEALAKNVVDAIDALTDEFPNWATTIEDEFSGYNWSRSFIDVDDFFLEGPRGVTPSP